MQNSLQRKNQQFRTQIRKKQIETYKKNRRKQLLEENNISIHGKGSEQQDSYWNLIHYTELSNLLDMNKQTCQNHFQMLNEIVFSAKSQLFQQSFEKILSVVMNYFQRAYQKWKQEGFILLQNNNCEIDSNFQDEAVQIFAITQVFQFIPSDLFTKLISGIYYEIVVNNLQLLRRTSQVLMKMLSIAFKDEPTIKDALSYFELEAEYLIASKINKQFILTAFLNMTYSEENQVIQVFMDACVLQTLSEKIETYGFNDAELQNLAGIYSNCIDFLCNKVKTSPVIYDQIYCDIPVEEINDYYFFLPLFQNLYLVQNTEILQKMVIVCINILQTIKKHSFSSKQNLMSMIEELVRSILNKKLFFEQMDRLFVLLAAQVNQKDYNYRLLTDLAIFLMKNNLIIYYNQEAKCKKNKSSQIKSNSTVVIRNLRSILEGCIILLERSDESQLQNQQNLIAQMMDFWCKQQLIMGSIELIIFMRKSIQKSIELTNWMLIDKFGEEMVSFMNDNYEDGNEKLEVLKLISAVCWRLSQSSELDKYLKQYGGQWMLIKSRVQGYLYDVKYNSNDQMYKLAEIVYAKLQNWLNNFNL